MECTTRSLECTFFDKNRINKTIKSAIVRGWIRNRQLKSEIAYLIGKVTGDGNLDKVFTVRFIGQKEDLVRLRKHICQNFSIPTNKLVISKRRSNWNGTSYLLQINDAPFGRLLFTFGAPSSDKTKTIFDVPRWIVNDKKFARLYLQGLLEDELTTIKIEKANHAVNPIFKLAKSELLRKKNLKFVSQIKRLLAKFDIECGKIAEIRTAKNSKTISAYFHINRNKQNIIRFKEKIGFRFNRKKLRYLDECYLKLQGCRSGQTGQPQDHIVRKLLS